MGCTTTVCYITDVAGQKVPVKVITGPKSHQALAAPELWQDDAGLAHPEPIIILHAERLLKAFTCKDSTTNERVTTRSPLELLTTTGLDSDIAEGVLVRFRALGFIRSIGGEQARRWVIAARD